MTNPLHDRLFAPHEGRDAPFLILPDGEAISYAAFLERSDRIARALLDLGLEPGDRLAVQVDKCPDVLAVYAAAIRTGIVILPLNTAYRPAEVDYFVADSGAKVLLADPQERRGSGPDRREERRPARDPGARPNRLAGGGGRVGRAAGRGDGAGGGRPGGDPLHLGHHRAIEGRDAVASQPAGRTPRP